MNEMRGRDEHRIAAADEHVQQEQYEVAVVQVAHTVVHPRAMVVHLPDM